MTDFCWALPDVLFKGHFCIKPFLSKVYMTCHIHCTDILGAVKTILLVGMTGGDGSSTAMHAVSCL